jgi:pyrroloquinoline-quinone synthase
METSDSAKALIEIHARADKHLNHRQILSSPFFEALKNQTMSIEQFRKTQEQFYFAVLFFSRPMAGLLARFPNPRQRLDLLKNLVEEHGDFRPDAFHETTFRQFLLSIGSEAQHQTINELALWPELRAFNSVLASACMLDELEVGVACIGIIEYVFADISGLIGRAVVEQGWLTVDKLVHFKLHAEIDKRHADEFFKLLLDSWQDKKRRYYVDQGLALGAYCFDNLYRDLFSASQSPDSFHRGAWSESENSQ